MLPAWSERSLRPTVVRGDAHQGHPSLKALQKMQVQVREIIA